MPVHLIAYDLAAGDDKAADLASAIMSLGDRWARPLATLWYLETEATASEVEARLSHLLGEEDGLVVQSARGAAALCHTLLRWTPARCTPTADGIPTRGTSARSAQIIAWPGRCQDIASAA